MNFVVDFGNTRIKAAIFDGSVLQHSYIFNSVQELIKGLKQMPDFNNCLIASVTNVHEEFIKCLPKTVNTVIFSANTKIPLNNLRSEERV